MAADHEQQVRALLREQPGGRDLAEGRFTPIAGGDLNRSWRVDTREGARFVRLAPREARLLGADWGSEVALLEIAGRAGLAPELVLADPGSGLLVTEFIDGHPLRPELITDTALLSRIGRLLRELHALAPAPGIRPIDFEAQARHLGQQLRPDPGPNAGLHARAATVFGRLRAAPGRRAPCHNDVHCRNLLDDNRRLLLVDWEYGGIGDPLFDLAGFLTHHPGDEHRIGVLLDAYGGRIDRARLRDACWAYDYVQWLWYRLAERLPGTLDTGSALEAGSATSAAGIAARLHDAV
jgi:aminoglycoside phosphotransferase (APT) family kinase protein